MKGAELLMAACPEREAFLSAAYVQNVVSDGLAWSTIQVVPCRVSTWHLPLDNDKSKSSARSESYQAKDCTCLSIRCSALMPMWTS